MGNDVGFGRVWVLVIGGAGYDDIILYNNISIGSRSMVLYNIYIYYVMRKTDVSLQPSEFIWSVSGMVRAFYNDDIVSMILHGRCFT